MTLFSIVISCTSNVAATFAVPPTRRSGVVPVLVIVM